MTRLSRWLVLMLLMCTTVSTRGEDVLVSAAASLKDALTELKPLCVKETGVTLVPNLAASGVLSRQIQAGAPADLFISADEATMDTLDKGGFLQPGSRADLLSNSLVFVVPIESSLKVESAKDLTAASIKRVAIGDAKTVPAGEYAVEFFQSQKVYDDLKDRLIPLENVRAVLAAVESNNVDVGVVYRSDTLASQKTKIAWAVPAAISPKIVYPIAVVKKTASAAAAEKVRQFLMSKTAREIFVKWGFAPPPEVKPAAAKCTP
jgi:molybdate transport system substrate-binding protein